MYLHLTRQRWHAELHGRLKLLVAEWRAEARDRRRRRITVDARAREAREEIGGLLKLNEPKSEVLIIPRSVW